MTKFLRVMKNIAFKFPSVYRKFKSALIAKTAATEYLRKENAFR